MVGGITFNGAYSSKAYSKDLENLAKYAAGAIILPEAGGPFQGAGLMVGLTLVPEAYKAGKWFLKYNKPKAAWAEELAQRSTNVETNRALLKNGGWQKFDTYKTLAEKQEIMTKDFESKYTLAKADDIATRAAKGKFRIWDRVKGFVTGKDSKIYADKKVESLRKEATEILGKTVAEEGAAKTLGLGANIFKSVKGSGPMAILSGCMELFSNIIPAFQVGTGHGVKQIGKSAVKVGASVVGWSAGEAIGTVVGGALGTLVAGPVGTAICAKIGGFVFGCIGCWVADKLAGKIVGKNETELVKEQQAKSVAKQVQQNPELQAQLLALAQQKLKEEGADSKDAKAAFGSMQRITKNTSVQKPANGYPQGIPSQNNPEIQATPGQQQQFAVPASSNYYLQYLLALRNAGIPA